MIMTTTQETLSSLGLKDSALNTSARAALKTLGTWTRNTESFSAELFDVNDSGIVVRVVEGRYSMILDQAEWLEYCSDRKGFGWTH